MKKLISILFFVFLFSGCSFFPQPANNNQVPTNLNQPVTKTILNFADCAAAGNPVMESYPRQCRANGQTFVEEIAVNINQPEPAACKDLCGDGVCQEIVCLAIGCPCSETLKSCPQDCTQKLNEEFGVISGKVTIGPICPVEKIGEPCTVPASAYTSRQVILYGSTGKIEVQKTYFNPNGTFAFSVPAGTYIVDIFKTGIERSSDLPITVTVKAGETVRVDFSIDTGIR